MGKAAKTSLGPAGTRLTICLAFAAVLSAVAHVPAWPQVASTTIQADDKGRAEFLANCAGCHGADAKGSGPHSGKLRTKPADLTALAKRNGGTFAAGAVYQMIDGRHGRGSHISAEMPIWGCRHADAPTKPSASSAARKHGLRHAPRIKSAEPDLESLLDLPCDSEATIQSRILSIVGYLSLLQEK
jgi:mono/diheme cytochrome c family protein